MLSACTGHSSTQVPQSIQVSSLTSAFSVTFIASTGHADAQAAQPVHVALSTFTAIMVLPRCTPDTGFPIYLFPSGNNQNKRRSGTIIPYIFILVYTDPSSCSLVSHSKRKTDTQIQAQDQKRQGNKGT
jgi:hypothetical protein